MKEETKSKLKKIAKVGGYAIGLAALFILGLGAGYCSAQKSADQPKASAKALSPRRANDGATDLLVDAPMWSDYAMYFGSGTVSLENSIGQSLYYLTRSDIPFNVDYYVLLDDLGHTYSCNVAFVSESIYGYIDLRVVGTIEEGAYSSHWIETELELVNFHSLPSSVYCFCLRVPSEAVGHVHMYSQSDYWEYLAPRKTLDLPSQWQPLNLWGQTYSNENFGSLYGVNDERSSYVGVMNVSGYIGDYVFDSLKFYFLQMQGVRFLDSEGNIVVASSAIYASLYYCNIVEAYNSADSTHLSLWWVNYGSSSDGNTYLARGGHWLDERYRKIVIWDYYGDQGKGVSTGYPEYTYFEWLSVVNSGGGSLQPTGDFYDVFSLVSSGFSSVASLLNIQILPFMTLGTLLLAPLVIILALVILKVLNK